MERNILNLFLFALELDWTNEGWTLNPFCLCEPRASACRELCIIGAHNIIDVAERPMHNKKITSGCTCDVMIKAALPLYIAQPAVGSIHSQDNEW